PVLPARVAAGRPAPGAAGTPGAGTGVRHRGVPLLPGPGRRGAGDAGGGGRRHPARPAGAGTAGRRFWDHRHPTAGRVTLTWRPARGRMELAGRTRGVIMTGATVAAGSTAGERPAEPLLSAHGVRKVYRTGDHEVVALDDLHLSVRAGEMVAVMEIGRASGRGRGWS